MDITLFMKIILLGILSFGGTTASCDQGQLDTNLPNGALDDQLSASSEQPYRSARFGRLNNRVNSNAKNFGAWCSKPTDEKPWFQVHFRKMMTITKVTIASEDFVISYVKTFGLKYSYNGTLWYNVSDSNGQAKIFDGIFSVYDINTVDIGSPITAQYFRIYPKTKSENSFCMKTDFHGCVPKKVCRHTVGIADRSIIKDTQFTASSSYKRHKPYDARLNNVMTFPRQWGAWCPKENDKLPWLQIDLGFAREISEIETQGHPYSQMKAWVTAYKLNYSMNGIEWHQYKNKTFVGNLNANNNKSHILSPKLSARFIRILPVSWNELACLRVEIYDCVPQQESIPRLLKGLKDVTIKRGETFNLKCIFDGQPGMNLVWYLNGNFLPTDSRISTQLYQLNETVLSGTLSFSRIKGDENGATFTCMAWYYKVNNLQTKSTTVITVLAPIPTLNTVEVNKTSVLLSIGYTGPLTKDVIGYTIRMYSAEYGFTLLSTNFNDTLEYNFTKLHPYTNYSVEVAMLYIENEVGLFYSKKRLQTLQDKPYGAPMDLQVTKNSHDSLYCKWSLPEADLCNGPITHYIVRYLKSMKKEELLFDYHYKTTNKTERILYNLDAGSNYEVSVQAYTKIGAGPFTHPPILIFTGKATEELDSINQMVINEGNAAAVGIRLQNITSDPKFLNKHDVELTIDILEKVVEAQNSSELLGESLVSAVSNVLKANQTTLQESEITNRTGTRYIQMLEKWLENVKTEVKELQEKSENVVVKKIFLNKLKIEEGIKFAEASGAEITIPAEALPKNKSQELYFVYFKTNKFFAKKMKLAEKCVDGFTVTKERVFTPVLSGDIVGEKTQNLSTPVVLKFKTGRKVNFQQSVCVYWDFKADDDKGNWSSEGCVLHSVVNHTITCHCNHLTNFAVMMDINAHTSKICGYHQEILSYISIVGCFLSLIGLFLTFLTYLLFRRLLKEMAAKVLIQLCVALFIVIVTFVTGIEQVTRPSLCTAVAVILHYATLVVFMWMLMEAAFMYHAFVRVWPPREGGDIYKSTIVAWGIPWLIVGITLLTSIDSYGGKHYCHVTGIPLYIAYLTPIGIIIIANCVMFMFIMYRLSTRPNSNAEQSDLSVAFVRLRRAVGIMILMGLTWAFGFGSASSLRLEFSYLFAVCNALQGFAIFIFYCVAQKHARMAWYRFFTCDTRSDVKRTTYSYYERRRLSSGASNKTNTLNFKRVGSNASSVFMTTSLSNRTYSNGLTNSSQVLTDKSVMNTIVEVESPPPMDNPLKEDFSNGIHLTVEEVDAMESSAEDEVLNMKLQEAEDKHKSKQLDIKQYSSYRALSGPSMYDVLNLVHVPSSKSLYKDDSDQASTVNFRKKSYERQRSIENRKSMINSFSHPHKHMRTAKSLEHLYKNKHREAAIPLTDISTIDLMSYRHVDWKENLESDRERTSTLTNTTVLLSSPFNENNNPCIEKINDAPKTYIGTGTLKSDVGTMTDNDTKLEPLKPPLHSFKGPGDSGRSQNDIIQWLHECDERVEPKDTDSEYSSSYYRTSRSSSMTDITSPVRHSSVSSSRDQTSERKGKEKELLDNMVIGPLKGASVQQSNIKNKLENKSKNKSSRSSLCDDGQPSEFSENGYSASEEDVFDVTNSASKNKLKKRRTRNRSLLKSNDYVTLEQSTATFV